MTPQPSAERGGGYQPLVLLLVLTSVAFANATTNGLVWLDHWQIESGGLIARSWPEVWSALRQPLGAMPGWEGSAPYARPCVVLLFSLIHAIAGTRPVAYHLTLEILHLANVVLVYSVLSTLRIDRTVAFLVAAVFAVHPLQTAAVSWVSGIADPLFCVFTLLALRLQLAASGAMRGATLARIGAVLSFIVALGAKETAAIFPGVLVAIYVLFPASAPSHAPRAAARIASIVRAVAPFCIVLLGAAFYRLQVLQAAAFGRLVDSVPLSVRLWTLPRLLVSYVILPLRLPALTVCDDYAVSVGWDASTGLAIVAIAALCAGLIVSWRPFPTAAFGGVWLLLGLLPVLNIVPILHYRADRFFYFPLIGWSLSVVVLMRGVLIAVRRSAIVSVEHLRQGTALATTVGLLLLVGLTIRRNAVFADDPTLFESTLQVSPFCREARTALGDAYLRAGRPDDAVMQYEQARVAQPDRVSYVVMPKVLINLGMAELSRKNYAAAAAAFSEAHSLQSGLLHPLFGLGIANLGLGQVATAATWLEEALRIAPNDPDVVLNLALSYDRLGRAADAQPLYRQYLEQNPHSRSRTIVEQRLRTLADARP